MTPYDPPEAIQDCINELQALPESPEREQTLEELRSYLAYAQTAEPLK